MIGSSPLEAPDETWGIGRASGGTKYALVRYTTAEGWTLGPQLLDSTGQPLEGFTPDTPSRASGPSPLAGQVTARGSGVLAGNVAAAGSSQQVVLVRDPGGSFQETPPVEGALLGPGEKLFAGARAPLIAPLDEVDGHAGAFVVPVNGGAQQWVLHWNGEAWTREEIEVPGADQEEKEKSGFQVLGIGASSPTNAWLLAQPSEAPALALYHRVGDVWKPVQPAPLQVEGESLFIAGSIEQIESQLLTVTSEGCVDRRRAAGAARAGHRLPAAERRERSCDGRVLAARNRLERNASTRCPKICPAPCPSGHRGASLGRTRPARLRTENASSRACKKA